VGRLYGPARKFYGRRRGLTSRGEPGRGFARGRELYELTGRLGGFPGENEAWEGSREERESSIALVNSP
jgi:hypothetical protein